MNKNTKFEKGADWYDLWMQQSRVFFESANEHLQTLQTQEAFAHPEKNLQQVNEWLESLKVRWQNTQKSEEDEKFQTYWKMIENMYKEASDLMLKEWLTRSAQKNPINNAHDLYELWLSSCQQIYQQTLQTKQYQDAYAELMNTAMKLWHAEK